MKKHLMSIITITILILFCVFKLASLAAEVTISKKSDLNISNLPDSLYIKGNAVVSASNDFILNHPNVYCIEHGKNLSMSSEEAATGKGYLYSKTVTKTIGDNNGLEQQIAYILNHNSYTTSEDSEKWHTPAQKALWKVIDVNGTGTFNDYATKDSITLANNSESKKLYDKSIAWKNAFNNGINASISSEYVNNGVKITVSGNFLEYDLLINGKSKKKGEKGSGDVVYTYTYSSSESGNINVQFNYVKKYTATFSIYSHSDFQNFIVVTNLKKDTNKSLSVDIPIDSDVSMQKYITKINDTNITDRSGLKSSEADNKEETSAYYLRYNKNVKPEKNGNDGIDARTPYKYDVPVKIDYGDRVTYRIEIYNNENRKATGITVADKLPWYKKDGKDTLYVRLESITDQAGNTINPTRDENDTRLKIQGISLEANASKYYDITVVFDQKYYKDSPIGNTAWLEGNIKDYYKNPDRPNIHRIADRDYVQMKEYAVGLEKFVTAVNNMPVVKGDVNADGQVDSKDAQLIKKYCKNIKLSDDSEEDAQLKKNIEEMGDINNDGKITTSKDNDNDDDDIIMNIWIGARKSNDQRLGHPMYNKNEYDKSAEANKVRVEPGDTVKFTIKITNTGNDNTNYGSIYISSIKDTITSDKIQLGDVKILDGTSSIIGNYNSGTISLDSPIEIEPTASTVIIMSATVNVVTANTNTHQYLTNTATVSVIKNRNDKEVKDSKESTDNDNEDSDYLKTKIYAVGLEKFVTAVNNMPVVKGDVNADGQVDSKDAGLIQKYCTNQKLSDDSEEDAQLRKNIEEMGDINNDGKITSGNDNDNDDDNIMIQMGTGYIKSTDQRLGHPMYNKNGYDKSAEANKVRVEPGDYVTFTIRVKNTGTDYINYGKISTTIIKETPDIKLTYDEKCKCEGGGYNTTKKQITFQQDILPNNSQDVKITFKVEVTGEATAIQQDLTNTATVSVIKNRNDQEVKDSKESTAKDNTDSDYLKTKIYAVSLEKFVSAVNGELVTDTTKPNYNCTREDRSGHPTYKTTAYNKSAEANKVRVEPGDYVTFTIRVKNTGTDYINYGKISTTIIKETPDIKLTYDEKCKCEGGTYSTTDQKITFEQDILPNESKDVTITFKVTIGTDQTLTPQSLDNTATVSAIKNRNDVPVKDSKETTDNDNMDRDYLLTKIYAVGIEKYVTGVGENGLITSTDNINYNCNVNSRENHPKYDQNKYDKSTDDNRVRVEPGDYVTFTIKVKNTGTKDGKADYKNYGKIGTTTISEIFTDGGNCKLVYDDKCSCSTEYKDNKITFVQDIVPGDSATLTIKFKVEVTGTLTGAQQNLENTATIEESSISNRNSVPVKDSDGDKNNTDSDYLRTKIYKVALEKYVTQVNDNALSKEAGANYNVKSLSERNGNPIYDSTNKENDIVNLETGDTVTFAIIVKNIGDNYINYGTIKTLEITDESSTKLQYNKVCQGARYNNGTITRVPSIAVGNEATIYLGYTVTLEPTKTKEKIDLVNTATINSNTIKNKHDVLVKEDKNSRKDKDNTDSDYLRTKVYAVSLEKFVSKVEMNGTDITDAINMGPQKEGMDRPREGYAEHNYNNSETTEENCDKTKRRNPVTTVTGDTITYTIKLKNDSEAKTGIDTNKNRNHDTTSYNTAVKIGKVIDYLPNGMKYGKNEYTNDNYEVTYDFKTSNEQTLSSGRLLQPGETATVTITAEVIEDKMSLNILKNVAEIDKNSLTNKNGKKVYDTTENNNKDADYIQLNYKHDPNPNNPDANPDPDNNAFFAGTVWNDMAPDKESEYYNTIMDNSERKLSGIKVDLYRNSYKKENNEMDYTPITKTIVATTITDENGNYLFGDQDIHLENQRENYIKGPKISNEDNRWAGYYGYYIVFTYDGITYTSTNNGIYFEDIYNSTKDYTKDSNASEYNVNESEISGYTTRKDFNSKFATINNSTKIQDKEIQYDRVNESGYIPESTYKYDPEIMSMKSLTKEIDLSTFMGMGTDKCLERSKYIGLGLRGRDIFDLELTSDVSKVEVKVNGITGTYDYTNKIGVRRGDVEENYYEDMANKYISEMKADYVGNLNGEEGQQIRQTDVKESVSKTDQTVDEYDYEKQLLQSILVTYKITVTNASETKTDGRATKVINYFDNKYRTDNITVEGGDIENVTSHSKYNSVLIDTTSDEIYITYELDNARTKLRDLGSGQLKTYNMAEIYEYTTTQYGDDDEKTYTKGILDKDSAPGSARIEKARLTNEQISEATTVDYYFGGTDLDKLKYEDDTYATPTLYFTTPGSIRVLMGTVFEDYTDVYTTDRIRTGNGKQDAIEPGIKGAKVQLIEKTSSGEEIIRYETFTNSSGKFTFTNYLPGNYIMRYFYGDNQETFYIGDTNTKSYNGEDFQATNNSEEVDGAGVHILPTNENYWYTYNYDEGISTATDIAKMREQVSKKACELSDDEMELLNNVRDGKVKVPEAGKREDGTISSLRDKLDMQAKTKQFTLTVEKSIKGKQNDEFDVYEVNKMNFGIAEVPVTTIDLQKHVNSFEIKDSTRENTIASAEITDKYIVEINKHNITDENKYNKVKAALEKAGVNGYTFTGYNTGEYGDSAENENITVNDQVNKTNVDNLRGYLITYSIPNIITITPTWKTVGNVLPGVKATNTVLDVSIEDAKLQGAKLQIKYDIAVSMYAEKDFSGTDPLQPSIDKVIDLIDNGVSYSDLLNSEGQWKVANASELKRGDSDLSETSGLERYPSTEFTTTIIESDSSNDLLQVKSGYLNSKNNQVTVERVLTSQDTSIQDIITSSIDAFEYQNTVKILQLDYTNSKVKIGGEEIKNKDRIRTPERYIIVPGKHHDSASSETIAIHPPTGDTSTHTLYYIIGAAGLAVLAIGAFGIKKFVLKGKGIKK